MLSTDDRAITAHGLNAALAVLRHPATIRQRAQAITAWVAAGHSAHFTIDRSALPAAAQRVATLTRSRFPDLRTPYHSRWRHFEAGGVDRKAMLDERLQQTGIAIDDPAAVARARIDLTLVSVLLDAGAGRSWSYHETATGLHLGRSEGLGVASFHAFLQGAFSSNPAFPCQVDAAALAKIEASQLAALFQVDPDHNPLVGLEGRAQLLRALGTALAQQPQRFGLEGRPGRLYDEWTAGGQQHELAAGDLLGSLLDAFSAIWPSGQWLEADQNRVPLGDVWPHPAAGGEGASAGWVPFHKLSQWLSYSLLEPLEWAGVQVTCLDQLTGLPEYRNGGLLIDAGVLIPRAADYAQQAYTPADPWVIEWRALTVALLDELAEAVRQALGVSAAALPLACILEGGSWAAGRQIAAERRADGAPPVSIISDGTVF